jgi:hypothetical protein
MSEGVFEKLNFEVFFFEMGRPKNRYLNRSIFHFILQENVEILTKIQPIS